MPSLPLRVLVLEDHLFQRSVAVSLLKQLGCAEVLEAGNGVEALTLLQAVGSVDVVLCDLQMEGMDGLEFIQRAGTAGQLGAVLISSCMPSDVRRAVRQMGSLLGLNMLGDVAKPLHADILRQFLEAYLSGRRSAQSIPACVEEASERSNVSVFEMVHTHSTSLLPQLPMLVEVGIALPAYQTTTPMPLTPDS